MKINENYKNLEESYLFSTIAKKVDEYTKAHPEAKVIKMGIGDVTLPICQKAADAFAKAAMEQGKAATFHGYGPEQGYDFLRVAVQKYYASFQVEVAAEDIFISDGAKSDVGNILDLFDADNTVLIPDPVYPVYMDAILLFDAAYESFVADPALPRSIFEIEGAKTCAIEFCSLSKLASFTGPRCGYTVVPSELERGGSSIRKMWLRRQTTKFNGVSYPVQRAAEAALSPEGMAQCREHLDVYRTNEKIMTETLKELGIWHIGGENSPYIWMQCPNGMKSWEFFDDLLAKANVVGTPGSGFGKNGEGFFRLTAFGTTANTKEAMERIKKVYGK